MFGALAAAMALALVGSPPETDARAMEPSLPVVELGTDGWLVAGRFPDGRSPDGNSVILKARTGLIIVDTGRNVAHTDAVMGAIAGLGKARPVAVINTHWHLDHISGNPAIRVAWPAIKVFGTSAIDGALPGFLARSAAASRKALAAESVPEAAMPDVQRDLSTIDLGKELRPDIVVDSTRDVLIAGRPLSLRIAHRAVTERDLWIYDAEQRRAIVGDLVTLPAPFLDTACPEGWLTALDEVAASGAVQVVPGHGPAMAMAGFNGWRRTFGDFIACTRGAGALETCSAGWLAGAGEWIGSDTARAKAMADYYGGLVRSGKLDGNCTA